MEHEIGKTYGAVTIAPPLSYRENYLKNRTFGQWYLRKLSQKHAKNRNIFVSSRDFWRVFGKKVKDKQGLVD